MVVTLACTFGAKDTPKAIFDELQNNPTPYDVGSCYQFDIFNIAAPKKVNYGNCS